MIFLDNLIEHFIKINRKMKRWQRMVSVLSAVIVFVTTYALILPAITLDKDTAQQQPGIEVAASEANAEERGAAAAGAEPEEESSVEETAEPEQIIEEDPEYNGGDDEPTDVGGETLSDEEYGISADGNDDLGDSADDNAVGDSADDNAAGDSADDNAAGGSADDNAAGDETMIEAATAGVTETIDDDIPAVGTLSASDLATAIAAGEIPLITEKTQLVYEYIDEEYEKNREKNKEASKSEEAGENSDEDVDDGYFVYAEFDGSAKLPKGVELQVKEITKENDPELYEMYCEKTLSEVKDKYDEDTGITFAKFYDISFVYQGTNVEPGGDVKIRIEYKREIEVRKDEKVDAIHFDQEADEKPEVIESEINPDDREKNGKKDEEENELMKAVEFTADRFSVYGVVGTSSITAAFLSADGNTYEVTVTCDTDANIPVGAELVVREVDAESDTYDTYIANAAKAMDVSADKIAYAKLLDISIVKDGEDITPETPVNVAIKLLDRESFDENESLNVIHYELGNEKPVLVDGTEQDGVVSFEAEGFSVYGVFYTVDFRWEVNGKKYEFSIPGGGFVSLEHLVEVLGIANSEAQSEAVDNDHSAYEEAIDLNKAAVSEKTREFVADVDSVEFSDPELAWVGKVNEDAAVREIKAFSNLDCEYSADLTEEQIAEIDAQTVKAGDWALISVKPFLSEEALTVTMKTGEVFTIKVTDGQLTTFVLSEGGGIYKVTVTYDKSAEIPEDARLVTRLFSEDEKEYQNARESIGKDDLSIMAFDISIHDSNENIVEPKSPVYVSIELFRLPEGSDFELLGKTMEVHHLVKAEGKNSEFAVLVADAGNFSNGTVEVREKNAVARFITDSFSVYTISWGSSNNQSVRLHFIDESGTELSGVTYNGNNVDGSSITISPTDTGIIQFDDNGELDLTQFTVSGKTLSSTHRGTPKDILPGVPKPDTNTDERRNPQPHSIIGNKLKWNGTNIQYQYFYTNDDKAGYVWMNAGYRPQTSDTNENHTLIPDDTPVFDGNENYDGTYTTYDYFLVYSPDYEDNGNSASQHGETPEIGAVGKDKQLTPNGDGTYTLDLSVTTEAKKDIKYNDINIILVLDTSSSMRRDANDHRPSDGANYDPTTRRMILTANAIEEFINGLKANNTPENPNAVEMALITFNAYAGYADPDEPITSNLDSIVTKVWDQNGGRDQIGTNDNLKQGTNWADGLRFAKETEFNDNDPTFVLFLTDGAPSEYWSEAVKPEGGLLFVDGEGCYLGAREEGRALASTGKDFYGVFSFGTTVDKNNDYLGDLLDYSYEEDVRSKNRFYADDGDELLAYLNQILKVIYDTVGHVGVNYQDGIALDTTSTALNTNVGGNLGGITYSKTGGTSPDYTVSVKNDGTIQSFKVGNTEYEGAGETSITYKKIISSGTEEEPEISAVDDTANVYQLTIAEGPNAGTYNMPMATLDIDQTTKVGDLNWDLAPLGMLEDGATYKISFVVWPDQDAYNYVADLKNGKKTWGADGATPEPVFAEGSTTVLYYKNGVKDYPNIVYYPDTDTYAVLTNTVQEVTYYVMDEISDEDTTYDGPYTVKPTSPDPMPLIATETKLEKAWGIDRNPGTLAALLYDEEGHPTQFHIDYDIKINTQEEPYKTLNLGWDDTEGKYMWDTDSIRDVTMKGSDGSTVTVPVGTRWTRDFSIATGLMLSETRMDALGIDKTPYTPYVYGSKNYYILETGNDYTIEEVIPEDAPRAAYEFDIEAPVYHPMLVDGRLKSVTFDRNEINQIISIKEISKEDWLLSLKIENTLRGYIRLEKRVVEKDGKTPRPDDISEFKYKIELENQMNPGPFTVEGSHIPWYGIDGLFYHCVDDNGHFHYFQAETPDNKPSHTFTLTTEAGKDCPAECVDSEELFNKDVYGPTLIKYVEDGEEKQILLYGNQLEHENDNYVWAELEIRQGQLLDIANVPTRSTYKIIETNPEGYDVVSIRREIRNGEIVESGSTIKRTYTISGRIVADRDNHIIYTNKPHSVDLTVKKIDENEMPMTGAVFTLTKAKSGDETEDTVYTTPEEGETDTAEYEFIDLPDGSYTLHETAPEGYAAISDIAFTVADGAISGMGALPAGVTWDGSTLTFTVVNTPVPEQLIVRKQWLDLFGNATSYDGTLDLTLTQWVDPPGHTVRFYIRCTGNGNGGSNYLGQITPIAEKSGTGLGDVSIQWDWNQYTTEQPFDVDGLEAGSTYTKEWTKHPNRNDGREGRETLTIHNITKDLVIYVTIRNNNYSGTDSGRVYSPVFTGIPPEPVDNVPTGGNKTVRLGENGVWSAAFVVSGEGLLSENSVNLPATYNGKQCYYTIAEESVPEGFTLQQISTDQSHTGALVAYNRRTTVDLVVEKIEKGHDSKRLNGATFELRQLDPTKDGSMDMRSLEGGRTETQITSGEGSNKGTLSFDSLGQGTYEIKETIAPEGYIIEGDPAFYIRVNESDVQLLQKDERKPTGEWKVMVGNARLSLENATVTVSNTTGAELPASGGPGTALFTILGVMLMAFAGTGMLVMKKRRRAA